MMKANQPPVKVIGYYTQGTPYADEYKVLKSSLNALAIPHEYTGIKNLGSWQKNTQFKAQFIFDWLCSHTEVASCLYLDVDAFVLRSGGLFDEWPWLPYDIGAHVYQGNELMSGTLFFNNNSMTRSVCKRWIEINAQYPDLLPDGRRAWDQRTLHMAIKESPCRFLDLGPEYTYAIGVSQQLYPNVYPYIVHTRGALKHQKEVDNNGS